MDRDTANRVKTLLEQSGVSLVESIDVVRGQLEDEAFHRYCLAIGTVLAGLQLDVLRPFVYLEYPDLAPKGPSDIAGQEVIENLKGKFAEAAERAGREGDQS